jgi:hypothetical protein
VQSVFRLSACVGGGPTRMSGRMPGAPSPPSQTAVPHRVPPTSCSALSRGWCEMPRARASGLSPCECLAGRDRSRMPETGRTWCCSLLSAWTGSSRVEGRSMPESSQQSWVLTARSSRNRPGGRIRSSRWRRRFACRNPGKTDVPSRKT